MLDVSRLNRLIEYEALAARRADTHTAGEYLADLRGGIWSEVTRPSRVVGVYRRNLQRAYVDAADRAINPPALPANATAQQRAQVDAARFSDARAPLRGELVELQRLVQNATTRTNDGMTRLHVRDLNLEITQILGPSRSIR
jgi:hypothetical protein